MSILSEDFGLIDTLHVTIPEDLPDKEPLGDSIDVLDMEERPACLMDTNMIGPTWPLRFTVNNCEIMIRRTGAVSRKVHVRKPKTPKPDMRTIRRIPVRHVWTLCRGIKIQ